MAQFGVTLLAKGSHHTTTATYRVRQFAFVALKAAGECRIVIALALHRICRLSHRLGCSHIRLRNRLLRSAFFLLILGGFGALFALFGIICLFLGCFLSCHSLGCTLFLQLLGFSAFLGKLPLTLLALFLSHSRLLKANQAVELTVKSLGTAILLFKHTFQMLFLAFKLRHSLILAASLLLKPGSGILQRTVTHHLLSTQLLHIALAAVHSDNFFVNLLSLTVAPLRELLEIAHSAPRLVQRRR